MALPRRPVRFAARGLALLGFGIAVSLDAADPEPRSLRVLASYPVPGFPSPATDVRWASDDSVHLARFYDGVVEVALGPGLPRRRQWVPDRETFGRILNYARLAASGQYVAVASHVDHLAWRPVAAPQPGQMVRFDREEIDIVEDVDLSGDRLLLLGAPVAGAASSDPQGVAWIGSLSSGLADFRALLRDSSGPAAPRLEACALFGLGAVRFLPGGSFAVVPGFQPGAHLFRADGTPLHTWSASQVGLDTDCSNLSQDEIARLHVEPGALVAWLNGHRALDDVLPFPAGPGLLVRSLDAKGKVRWQLRVLQPSGVLVYDVPLVGERPVDRLHGDVRDGRIVLLLSEHVIRKENRHSPGRLVVAQVPPELAASASY